MCVEAYIHEHITIDVILSTSAGLYRVMGLSNDNVEDSSVMNTKRQFSGNDYNDRVS